MNDNLLKAISLLYVEDDRLLRKATGEFLKLYFDRIVCAENGRQALELFNAGGIDLVLTDICMPEVDGLQLAEILKKISPETPVVVYTAFTEIPYLIKGIELGIAGFVQKPTDAKQLLATLVRAALPVAQRKQLVSLQDGLRHSVETMLGSSGMKNIAEQVVRGARTDYTLLIQGETGTGKSRLANIIHKLSPRAAAPFVTVQLAALPESLVTAELFGHEKGAFTGADRRRDGLVKSADGGTLFLDDIDAASPLVQSLLLQLVDDKTFTPIGSSKKTAIDLRIIAASNRDLALDAETGLFRRDLYYRLAGLLLELPPLRIISADIPALASDFLQEACQEIGRTLPHITPEAMAALQRHPWPGNIRELRNVIKRLAIVSDDIIHEGLVTSIVGRLQPLSDHQPAAPLADGEELTPPSDLPLSMDAVEKWALQRALQVSGHKKMVAARLLDMNYYTFRRRLARHGLEGAEGDEADSD